MERMGDPVRKADQGRKDWCRKESGSPLAGIKDRNAFYNPCSCDPVCEIDLGAISFNLRALRSKLKPQTDIIAVVKADAYGHGAVEVAAFLEKKGVRHFAVATVGEALELRRAGVKSEILTLVPMTASDMEQALRLGITISIGSLREAELLNTLSFRSGLKAKVHVMVDTGLSRGGFLPGELKQALEAIRGLRGLEVTGAWGHFASTNSRAYTQKVIEKFRHFCSLIQRTWPRAVYHLASSAAAWTLPESHFSLIRPGLCLYGYLPGRLEARDLKPAFRLLAPVVSVKRYPAGTQVSYEGTYQLRKESTIVTIRCGYADGYPFLLSNKGTVHIRGKDFPVAGRVTMDQLLVDVGDFPVSVGEMAVLLGPPGLSVPEAALRAQTIPYVILTSTGRRVGKVFLQEKQELSQERSKNLGSKNLVFLGQNSTPYL